MTGRACSAEATTGAMTGKTTGATGAMTGKTTATTGKTTAATAATTGKTGVVVGLGCSGSLPWRLPTGGATPPNPEGVAMTVTADGVMGKSGARASRPRPARAGTVEQLSRADRAARGKEARALAPLEAHAEFAPGKSRDPVGLLLEQAKSRVPELVPVRHGRMLVSPFTFYRGAPLLEVWYAHLDIEQAIGELQAQVKAGRFKAAEGLLAKAHTRDSTQALAKLTTVAGGRRRIISDPPMIVPVEEVFADVQADAIYEELRAVLGKYRRTLQSDRRHLLEQFTLVQVARKVVGVGSVGTRAWVLLMDAADGVEPLFLQAKEAQPSVLAGYCGRSQYANQGERVVAGQHLMQAHSDIFLGWTRARGPDGADRDFYVRQLRDWKFSAPIEQMIPAGMTFYARLCGWTLARAHARSGDRIALASYLGGSAKFDQAIAGFAETYADQNERDYAALQAAVKNGTAQATTEI